MPSKRDLVVACDAGGAYLLREFFDYRDSQPRVLARGAAREIWANSPGLLAEDSSLYNEVRSADRVLCGTGWSSNFEILAMQLARSQGKQVIAFLDSPYNLHQRFEGLTLEERPSLLVIPDTVVGEVNLSDLEHLGIRVRVVADPILLRAAKIRARTVILPTRALFLSQPLRASDSVSSSEFFKLAYSKMRQVIGSVDLVARIHPADRDFCERVGELQSEMDFQVSSGVDFVKDIISSHYVFGINSNGLRIASSLGIQVFALQSKLSGDSMMDPPKGVRVLRI